MADWREVAQKEGWAAFKSKIRLPLAARKHTVHVVDYGDELEFFADVPDTYSPDQLLDLLIANRSNRLAYWHVDEGVVWAVSRCPRLATKRQMAAYIRETAALADRLEMRLSDVDWL